MLIYPLMPVTGFLCKQKLCLSSGTNFYEYMSWNVGYFYKVCKWKWKILKACPGMWRAYISVWTWVSKSVLAFRNGWFIWFRASFLANWWYMPLHLYLMKTPVQLQNLSSQESLETAWQIGSVSWTLIGPKIECFCKRNWSQFVGKALGIPQTSFVSSPPFLFFQFSSLFSPGIWTQICVSPFLPLLPWSLYWYLCGTRLGVLWEKEDHCSFNGQDKVCRNQGLHSAYCSCMGVAYICHYEQCLPIVRWKHPFKGDILREVSSPNMSSLFIQLFKEANGNLLPLVSHSSVGQGMSGNMFGAVSFPTPCLGAKISLKHWSNFLKSGKT